MVFLLIRRFEGHKGFRARQLESAIILQNGYRGSYRSNSSVISSCQSIEEVASENCLSDVHPLDFQGRQPTTCWRGNHDLQWTATPSGQRRHPAVARRLFLRACLFVIFGNLRVFGFLSKSISCKQSSHRSGKVTAPQTTPPHA